MGANHQSSKRSPDILSRRRRRRVRVAESQSLETRRGGGKGTRDATTALVVSSTIAHRPRESINPSRLVSSRPTSRRTETVETDDRSIDAVGGHDRDIEEV